MLRKGSMKIFYTVWLGQLISTVGSSLTGFALGIWIYQSTRSVTFYSLSLLVFVVPKLILSPIAGVVADRYDRRLVMIVSDLGAGLSTLVIGLLFWNGSLEVWHVLIAQAINAIFNTFQRPAYTAATTLLVPKENLGKASGLVQIAGAASQLLAPAVAGVLFISIGLTGVIVIDFITFIFAVGTLFIVRFPQPKRTPTEEGGKQSVWQEAKEGWQFIRSRTGFLVLLLYFAVVNFFASMLGPLIVPMLLEQTTPEKMGYIASFTGLGMLVGAIFMSKWGGPKRKVLGIITSVGAMGLFTMLLGYPSIWVIPFAGFFMMMMAPIANGTDRVLWQTKVPPELQGRVFSLTMMMGYVTPVLAMLAAGPLAEGLFEPALMEGGALAATVGQFIGTGAGRGTAFLFVTMGFLQLVASAVAWFHPRLRNLESEIPDAIPDSPATEVIDPLSTAAAIA